MTKRTAPAVALLAILALSGCAPSVSDEDIEERFAIELAGAIDIGKASDYAEVAEGIGEMMRDGGCGSEIARSGFESEPALVYAWDMTCLMYFEDDMSQTQKDRALASLNEKVLEDIDG